MKSFLLNGYLWHIEYVNPESSFLVDRTNTPRVATTDPRTLTVYISNDISGNFLRRVLIHELGHCVMFSYDLLNTIHRMTPQTYWVEMEEWICNFLADYGLLVFHIASRTLGEKAMIYVPQELEKIIA